ncbi:MAG TPA: hypothetical protein VGB98_12240 [Pyrinomonadaceae bacterium]|jgi:hypothetical protein
MSRRKITGKNPNHECVVGWDTGMSTFFGMVTDAELEQRASAAGDRVAEALGAGRTPDPDDERLSNVETILLWVGASRVGEIQTVEELAGLMEPFATVEADVLEALRADRATAGEPSASQRAGQEFIRAHGTREGV